MSQKQIWTLVDYAADPPEIFAVGFASEDHAREEADGYHDQIKAEKFESLEEIKEEFSEQDLEWIEANEDDLAVAA